MRSINAWKIGSWRGRLFVRIFFFPLQQSHWVFEALSTVWCRSKMFSKSRTYWWSFTLFLIKSLKSEPTIVHVWSNKIGQIRISLDTIIFFLFLFISHFPPRPRQPTLENEQYILATSGGRICLNDYIGWEELADYPCSHLTSSKWSYFQENSACIEEVWEIYKLWDTYYTCTIKRTVNNHINCLVESTPAKESTESHPYIIRN